MTVVWHPNRWWYWCMPEGEKREVELIFTE